MDNVDRERRDLDPADLDEVRRRVVEPVLDAMFERGELTEVTLSFDEPLDAWSPYGHGDAGLWLCVRVGSERFIHPVAKAGFWLDDVNWVAGELEEKLAEWICESRFGWGQWRSMPEGWAPPPPQAGRSTVSIHFVDEDDGLPLWTDGLAAPALEARLSAELTADLRAWQALGVHLSATANSAHQIAAWEARREWIDALEPWRDELIELLRIELGQEYVVPNPPRVL